ncbi:MAG: long-chain fatty acid--CoA ligase [Dehalococcoidia bacterium]
MNIGGLLDDNIQRFGEYDFVCFEGKWHSNVEINHAVNQLAIGLKNLGIKIGDRVGVQLLNCPQLLQSFFAIFKIGAILVPINPALRADELAYLYHDAGLSALITSTDFVGKIRQARQNAPGLKHVITIEKEMLDDALAYDTIMRTEPGNTALAETDNDDVAVIIYTAGTTGNPKGVMLTHYNWYTHVTGYYELVLLDKRGIEVTDKDGNVFGVRRNRVSLVTLPLYHGYGVFAMNLEFLTGGKMVLLSRWDTEEAMKSIEQYRVTEFRGVPTMYIQLLNHPAADKYDLSSLRVCICGSAPMPLEVARQWKIKYGIDIWEGYGLSEATTVNCGNIAAGKEPRYGSIGKCYQKCNTIAILGADDGELPVGETGEIAIKGPCVMKGYWNKPRETADAIRNGWLHTGDIGHKDKDGYIYITDRKKDLIIRGGENVYPKEVENVLHGHPQVLECGVIGIPDSTYGEEVMAFVVLKIEGSATERDLIDYCRERLPAFKRPKTIRFMDSLPKSSVGKILRRELRINKGD